MPTLLTAGCMASGMACVFLGITFINGQLLPQMLEGVYQAVPSAFVRTLIVNLTIVLAANILISKGYVFGGQAIGGSFYVLSLVIAMVTTAMLVDKVGLNMHILGGVGVLCAGALWVVYGLSQGTAT